MHTKEKHRTLMMISLQLMDELSLTLHGAPHASSAEIFCRYRKSYFGLIARTQESSLMQISSSAIVPVGCSMKHLFGGFVEGSRYSMVVSGRGTWRRDARESRGLESGQTWLACQIHQPCSKGELRLPHRPPRFD